MIAQLFVHRDACGKVDAVLFLDAACTQQHTGVADLLDIVLIDIAIRRGGQLVAILCLAEFVGIPQHADVAALRGKHLAAFFKGGAVGDNALSQPAAGGHVALAGQHQHIAGQLQAYLGQVSRAPALQDGHALRYFKRVADISAQRLVHIGDQRSDPAAVRRANRNHLARQLKGAVQILHEGAVSHRHIKQNGV